MAGGRHELDWEMMGEVLVMRHPQTLANAEGRFLGRGYAPLTELGETQCLRAVQALVAYAPDRLLSSPLDRCLGIARPAAERCGIEVEVWDDLTEMDFGVVEGHRAATAVEEGYSLPWGPTAAAWPVEGAESIEDLCLRTARAAQHVAGMGGRVAIVSHGGAVRGLLAAWLAIPHDEIWEMAVRNVCSSIIGFDASGAAYLVAHGLSPEQVPAARANVTAGGRPIDEREHA